MEKSCKEQYSDLLEVIRKMTLNLDLDKVLDYIVESVAKFVQASDSSLILIDNKANRFYFKAVYGEKSESIKYLSFELDEGIAGWVAKEKKPLLVEDVSKDARFSKTVDKKSGFKTKSIICVPLEIKERVVGVLEVLNSEDDQPFTEGQFDLLLAFARQAAIAIENSKRYTEALKENASLHDELNERYKLITSSKAMNDVLEMAKSAAQSDSTILISGESGTGKELLARNIYQVSPRNKNPFVVVNCASLSEELLESDLFGHEKGAFTGAHTRKQGKLQSADTGTVFFDEIGELKLSLQAKLLRVLQEHTFERVGGTEEIEVDVRFICATNKDLKEAVNKGSFRADLYYRLNVIPIKMPPLRERRSEIPVLAKFFIERYCGKTGQIEKLISSEAMHCLTQYNWPGNIRELENIIERSVVLQRTNEINPQNFLPENENISVTNDVTNETIEDEAPALKATGYRQLVKNEKRQIIRSALKETDGNRTKAAKLLEIQPSYLCRLINELEIVDL